ncbi:MAG: DoxX family protein [Actinomycetota bacterium]|nr:DoxX family protein [Actinomycetota bacterium]
MTTFTPLAPSAFPGTTGSKQVDEGGVAVPSRTVADLLFRSTATAPLWLVVRLWLGYQWFVAGWNKLNADGRWFGDAPALKGFVGGADAKWANRAEAHGHPAVHYAWFLDFLHFIGDRAWLFGPLIVIGELLIGLGLIAGVATRWAALAAVALNIMYVTGGSAGVNGIYIALAVLLICAWRVAGHLGGDRFIVGRLGRVGRLDRHHAAA